jgi:hypothetical protein
MFSTSRCDGQTRTREWREEGRIHQQHVAGENPTTKTKSLSTSPSPQTGTTRQAQPMVNPEQLPCRHGAPMVVEQERIDAVEGYIKIMGKRYQELKTATPIAGADMGNDQRNRVRDKLKISEQFWSEPTHARLIDVEIIHFCYANAAAEMLLGKNIPRSTYDLAFLGIYLTTWVKLGKDTFLQALWGGRVEGRNIQPMVDFKESMGKIGCERGCTLC